MAGSYKKIDYRVRPGKSIERKMLAEAFRRLNHFHEVSGYTYVGMGSLYFADFSLFHRSLGFERMISIENTTAEHSKNRFLLNVPFSQIEMQFGHSNVVLQRMAIKGPLVVWLDYDGLLDKSCLTDIKYVAKKAPSGSVIVVTANADAKSLQALIDEEEGLNDMLDVTRSLLGEEHLPPGLTAADIHGGRVGDIFRAVIHAAIEDGIRNRNTEVQEDASFSYLQIFNFRYSDGARMLTVGGVLLSKKDDEKFKAASFEQLPFTRTGDDSYFIDPPSLTFSEMRRIDACANDDLCALGLPMKDVERYRMTYRYFPNFVEAEVS